MEPRARQAPIGAYGLRVEGLDGAARLLVPADPTWPRVEVAARQAASSDAPERLTDDDADLRTRAGNRLLLERSTGVAVFESPDALSEQALVHPGLAPVGAVWAHWLGRQSFHAGGLVVGGRVWGVFGRRGSGKSTTLARAAQLGAGVVADDLLVLAGNAAFAGPRSIDLRREAAERLGAGEPAGIVGLRERWRFVLPSPPNDAVLCGWVVLEWGDHLTIDVVPPRERLERLVAERGLSTTPRDQAALLDLAALPALRLTRPRTLDSLDAAVETLLTRLA